MKHTLKILAVSSISAMNVDTPRSWLSPAPTRHNTESKIGICASEQGTKLPVWAMRAMTPTCRMYVLFPPMLGPAERRERAGQLVSRTLIYKRTYDLELARVCEYGEFELFSVKQIGCNRTFNHLDIIRDEADVVLHL